MSDPLDHAIFGGPEPAEPAAVPTRRQRHKAPRKRTGRKLLVLVVALALLLDGLFALVQRVLVPHGVRARTAAPARRSGGAARAVPLPS